MKLRKNIILAMTVALVATSPAWGEGVVTLDSCRNMAVRNNKAIKIAQQGVETAGYRKKSAFASYLPGIDFTGTYMYNQHQIELLGEDAKLPTMSFNPATGQFDMNLLKGPDGKPVLNPETGEPIPSQVAVIPKEAMSYDVHNVVAGAITLTQPVFMGGQIRALNGITKYAEKLAESMRNTAIADVIYATDEAYWRVVSLKAKKKLAENFVLLVDTLRYNVDQMMQEGVATRSDVLTVEVKYNEAQIALTKVDNGLTLSRMALAQICGLPIDTKMTLLDEEGSRIMRSEQDIRWDLQSVYSRRPEIQSMLHGISIFEQKEKLALGEMLPKVAIVGAYSFSNPNVIHGFEKRFGGGFSVGAMVQIPIWHWGGNYNSYRAAKSETAAQRLLLEDVEEKIDLQVNQAKFSYDEAYKTYDMTVKNMQKAEENLRQAELGFREGVLTTDDVIAAQTAWLQANSEKIDAEIGIQLCRVYLSKVLGTLMDE